MAPEKPTLNLIAPAPIVFGVPFFSAVALHFLFDTIRLGLPGQLALMLGGLILLASVSLGAWSITVMFKAGENPDPRYSTNALLVTGPFAFSRNPIYVSFVLGGVGIALGIDSLFILLSVPAGALAVDRLVIVREEEYLSRLFGDVYRQYASRVRRWL